MSKGKYFVYQPDGDGCMEFVAQEGAWGPVIIDETIAVKLLNESQERIKQLEEQVKQAQIKGFTDGWETSGEGYNSEHGGKELDVMISDYMGLYAINSNKGSA